MFCSIFENGIFFTPTKKFNVLFRHNSNYLWIFFICYYVYFFIYNFWDGVQNGGWKMIFKNYAVSNIFGSLETYSFQSHPFALSPSAPSKLPTETSLNKNIMPNSMEELHAGFNSNFKHCSTKYNTFTIPKHLNSRIY